MRQELYLHRHSRRAQFGKSKQVNSAMDFCHITYLLIRRRVECCVLSINLIPKAFVAIATFTGRIYRHTYLLHSAPQRLPGTPKPVTIAGASLSFCVAGHVREVCAPTQGVGLCKTSQDAESATTRPQTPST